jgi:long-chain acyl-CoA synthetase
VAHVVPKDGDDPKVLKRELRDFCAQRLSAYKVPRRFEIVSEIPKTFIGKAIRWQIREREEQRGDTADDE